MRLPGALLGLVAAALAGTAAAHPDDMSLGSAKAPVTVVEYASVSCPHCAAWHEQVFPTLKAKWVDGGKVRFVLRETPFAGREPATAGWLLARCAGKARYFGVVDRLMREQAKLREQGDATGWLSRGAAAGGLKPAKAHACMTDPKAVAAFNARFEANMAEQPVRGVPAFFVNGRPVEGDMQSLDEAIRAELGRGGG